MNFIWLLKVEELMKNDSRNKNRILFSELYSLKSAMSCQMSDIRQYSTACWAYLLHQKKNRFVIVVYSTKTNKIFILVQLMTCKLILSRWARFIHFGFVKVRQFPICKIKRLTNFMIQSKDFFPFQRNKTCWENMLNTCGFREKKEFGNKSQNPSHLIWFLSFINYALIFQSLLSRWIIISNTDAYHYISFVHHRRSLHSIHNLWWFRCLFIHSNHKVKMFKLPR